MKVVASFSCEQHLVLRCRLQPVQGSNSPHASWQTDRQMEQTYKDHLLFLWADPPSTVLIFCSESGEQRFSGGDRSYFACAGVLVWRAEQRVWERRALERLGRIHKRPGKRR